MAAGNNPPGNSGGGRFEQALDKFRLYHMAVAEAIDVWRVVPRLIIMAYTGMLWGLVKWFTSATTIEQIQCDSGMVLEMLRLGVDINVIQTLACSVTQLIVVAPPTAVHAAFASVVAGLSTTVFALYTTAGKDWTKGVRPWNSGRNRP